MNTDLIISSIFSGIKPMLPLFILIAFIVLFFVVFKILMARKKSHISLFKNNIFEAVPLLNKQEIKVYESLLENIQVASNNEYKVFAQVSLGEILKNSDRSSFNRINQKRADFCIVDRNYMPIAVIEYHGGGHYRGNYQERDEIKQQATEYAGLIYHAILERDFVNLSDHINNVITPLLRNKPNNVSRKLPKKDQRIEPTF